MCLIREGDELNALGCVMLAVYASAIDTSYLITGSTPPSAGVVLNLLAIGLPYDT